MNIDTSVDLFKEILHDALFLSQINTRMASAKLYQLLIFMIDRAEKEEKHPKKQVLLTSLIDFMHKNFEILSAKCTKTGRGTSSARQFFITSYYEYMSRLKTISKSIYLLSSRSMNPLHKDLMQDLEDHYMYQTFDLQSSALEAYAEVCEDYIRGSEECRNDLLIIHGAIYQHLLMSIDKPILRCDPKILEFFNMGASCLRAWVETCTTRNFIQLYKAYQNTLDISKIIQQDSPKESGLGLVFNDDVKSFMQSLDNIALRGDMINAICKAKGDHDKEWIVSLREIFKKSRPIKFSNGNFDQLLISIILNNCSYTKTKTNAKTNTNSRSDGECMIIQEAREIFQKSIHDVSEFHLKLLNYMDLHFQKDFRRNKNSHLSKKSSVDALWVSAMASLIVYYIPSRSLFLKSFLRQGLFRQMLMLNTKFPSYFEDPNCLEHTLIDGINRDIPYEMYFVRNLVKTAISTLRESSELNNHMTIFNRLYIGEELAIELSLPLEEEEEPPWPTKDFKNTWNQEKENFHRLSKKLHGMFSMHLLSVSTPIILPSGKKLTLIGDIAMASILYQFNDCETISEASLYKALGNNGVTSSLHKLLRHNILSKSTSHDIKINAEFKATSTVSRLGILRIS